MLYTIEEFHKKVYENALAVYDVFKDFFGEEFVDFQPSRSVSDLRGLISLSSFRDNDMIEDDPERYKRSRKAKILVWWPRVKVTNENNKSTTIRDLYACIEVETDGTIPYEFPGFTLNRSTYSLDEWLSNYMHSHVNGIPKSNPSQFLGPCMGRGPIRETIMHLKNHFDTTMWMLFCQELSMYVTVESLRGIPYRYLERIGGRGDSNFDISFHRQDHMLTCFPWNRHVCMDFIRYYIEQGELKFSYRNNRFVASMTDYELLLDITKAFINYFNANLIGSYSQEYLLQKGVIFKVFARDGKLYDNSDRHFDLRDVNRSIGKFVCVFKGREIRLDIKDINDTTSHEILVLNPNVASYFVTKILYILNNNYINEYSSKRRQEETAATACEKVLYI